jgi:formamidopyrimidine-DNA glycosylase
MPESPEVYKYAQVAHEKFKGKTVVNVTGWDVQNNDEIQQKLQELCPATVDRVWSFGKRIFVQFLHKPVGLELHLGLEGCIVFENPSHPRLYLFASDNTHLIVDNHKGIGRTKIVTSEEIQKTQLCGVDPLHELDTTNIYKALVDNRKRRVKIATFLLEQKSIVGIGNYLRAEILYDAKINPHLSLRDLSDGHLQRLTQSIFNITQKFRDSPGFSKNYLVYRRLYDPDGNPVQAEEIPAKRVMFWVPNGMCTPPAGVPAIACTTLRVPNGMCTPPAGVPNGMCTPPAGVPNGMCIPPAGVPNGMCTPPAGVPNGMCTPPAGVPNGMCTPPAGVPNGMCTPPAGVPNEVCTALDAVPPQGVYNHQGVPDVSGPPPFAIPSETST